MKLENILILFVIITGLLLQSCNTKPKNYFEIEGTIINNPENIKTLYINYPTVGDTSRLDSVTITNNKFHYDGILAEPVSPMLIGTQTRFYTRVSFTALIETGLNPLEINLENLDFVNLKDTPIQKEYELLRPVRINNKKSDSLWAIQCNDTLASKSIILQRKQFQDSLSLFNMNYSKAFIRQYQPSYVTLSEMPIVWYWGGDEGKMIVDSILVLLPESFNNNLNIIRVNEMIEEARIKSSKISDIGQPATDFSLPDINGNTVSLSNFKGYYVLLDFWASWCRPCRDDIPFVKKIYKEYHKKGLEIIAISIDDKKEDWIKAIHKEETQMFVQTIEPRDSKKGMESVTNIYYADCLPYKILIDKNGIIICRWAGSGEENEKAIKKFLKENIK